jgi:peptide/nickel transport system substrate-binding protein
MADDIRSRSALEIRRLLLPQYYSLFFNDVKNEILGDEAVRTALLLATDRDEIIARALQEEARPLHIPLPFGMFELVEGKHPFDPHAARETLEEAGWTENDGGWEKDDDRLSVTITTSDWPEFIRTAELVKRQWESIGVEVELENYGAGVIQQTVVGPREYEILLYGQILSVDPDPYPFWHSTQTRSPGLNLSLVKDETLDKALEESRKMHDREEREEQYIEFQNRFLELNPAIILYQPHYLFAHHVNVRGQTMYNVNLPHGRFHDIHEWHVRTKRVWND